MAFKDCIAEVEAAAGRKFSDDELDELFTTLQRREKLAAASSTLESSDQVLAKEARDLAEKLKRAAFIEKRNAAIALRKGAEAYDFIKTNFPNDPGEGLKAMMVGTNLVRDGSRFSVAAQQKELLIRYVGGLLTDLEAKDLLKVMKDGALDREISRALFTIDNPNATPYAGIDEAMEIAKILHKWQEVVRKQYNDAGADIGKELGYIVKQSHDSDKLRTAGYQAWRDAIMPKLDMARTFADGRDPEEALQAIYANIVSGDHRKAKDEITGFKGGTFNLGKRASAERVLHFKDADNWFDYNTQFGIGGIMDATLRTMETSAQNIGLMRKLGPNPRDVYNRLIERVRDDIKDPTIKAQFLSDVRPGAMLDNYFAAVDGTTNIPVASVAAQVSSGVRAFQNMSKLGGALIASAQDLVAVAAEMRYQGAGDMFSGMGEAIAGLSRGQNRAGMREIDAALPVFFEGMRDGISARFDPADNLPGSISRLQQLFFKANGLTWWTDTLRAATVRSFSHHAGSLADAAFDALPKDFSRVLSLYGIDAGKWDIIRSAPQKLADGRSYLTPDTIRDLPDAQFVAYLEAQGKKPSDYAVRQLREEVVSQFRTYFSDRASYAVLEPDAQTRALLLQGTQPGTVQGELLRFIGQFKSFPVAFVQKVIGREVYGRGADTLSDALKNTNGEMLGMAQLFVWSTLFGYGIMTAKEIIKGREPRTPETPAEYAKLVQAAMLQGGGLGIFGDFLFGEMKNRYGQSALGTLLGPTFATVGDVMDLFGRAKSGDDFAGQALRVALNNTPFANLFYTKAALDYLVVYRIQESLNPGYLKRMEERVQRENSQSFIFPPSQYAQ